MVSLEYFLYFEIIFIFEVFFAPKKVSYPGIAWRLWRKAKPSIPVSVDREDLGNVTVDGGDGDADGGEGRVVEEEGCKLGGGG